MNVYFIRCHDQFGNIKIGYANDVAKRLQDLQIGSPSKLSLIHSFACTSVGAAQIVEKNLHFRFRYCNRSGEWFSPDQTLREFIAFMAAGGILSQGLEIARKNSKKKVAKAARRERFLKLYTEKKQKERGLSTVNV